MVYEESCSCGHSRGDMLDFGRFLSLRGAKQACPQRSRREAISIFECLRLPRSLLVQGFFKIAGSTNSKKTWMPGQAGSSGGFLGNEA